LRKKIMENSQEKEQTTPTASGDKQTPIEPSARTTGTDARDSDVREGAEPEAPGNNNAETPGSPNQGTESR
jgi:hypothetical protein